MKTAEEMLKARIAIYNSAVNDMSKLSLTDREVKMFTQIMDEYANQSKQPQLPEVEGINETVFIAACTRANSINSAGANCFKIFQDGVQLYAKQTISKMFSKTEKKEAIEVLRYVLKKHHIIDTFIGRKFQVIGTNTAYSAETVYKVWLSNNSEWLREEILKKING